MQKRSGKTCYRVTGTLGPGQKQQKRVFSSYEDAQACADDWEAIRCAAKIRVRLLPTRLKQTDLADAEAARRILPAGVKFTDLARHYIQSGGVGAVSAKPLEDAVKAFLVHHKTSNTSSSQIANYRAILTSLIDACGTKTSVDTVTTEQLESLLTARKSRSGGPILRSTWNIYRGDLAAFFNWCSKRPRSWLGKDLNPVSPLVHYSRRQIVRPLPPRLDIAVCREMMNWVETYAPNWVCFFAITLFAGVRPDMSDGEMAKLARLIQLEGPERYFIGGVLRLPATVTKDRRPRQVRLPHNLIAYLEKYPPTPLALNPGDFAAYTKIRRRFSIPHDGLRHTAISGFVAAGGTLTDAALEFGTSERIIRLHYLNQMTEAEAVGFYDIRPFAASLEDQLTLNLN